MKNQGVISKMTNCTYCKKTLEELPYTCKFCKEEFCSDHRLPEKHECEGLKKYKENKEKVYFKEKLGNKKRKRLPKHYYHPPKQPLLSKIKGFFKK